MALLMLCTQWRQGLLLPGNAQQTNYEQQEQTASNRNAQQISNKQQEQTASGAFTPPTPLHNVQSEPSEPYSDPVDNMQTNNENENEEPLSDFTESAVSTDEISECSDDEQ